MLALVCTERNHSESLGILIVYHPRMVCMPPLSGKSLLLPPKRCDKPPQAPFCADFDPVIGLSYDIVRNIMDFKLLARVCTERELHETPRDGSCEPQEAMHQDLQIGKPF